MRLHLRAFSLSPSKKSPPDVTSMTFRLGFLSPHRKYRQPVVKSKPSLSQTPPRQPRLSPLLLPQPPLPHNRRYHRYHFRHRNRHRYHHRIDDHHDHCRRYCHAVCPVSASVWCRCLRSRVDAAQQSTSDPDANMCCTSCFDGNGCGIWFYFVGAGCFHGVGETGPDPSAQCPLGLGTWSELTGQDAGAGDVGVPGPCFGGFIN